eukprot:TRINITY_DN64365_c0_g1_i1.p1 TRINITY_DN64365_c0_g1~~TRINITY_DN64365_c0_g1_i1.p1  ORF type:complete len:348 (-),score=38.80 TRINITY_DN64365_c0_g1_i1:149-1192(-)
MLRLVHRSICGVSIAASRSYLQLASPMALLDHVNLNVPVWTPELQHFWFDAVGFARDPRDQDVYKRNNASGGTMTGLVWANIGLQQIHMPVGEPEHSLQRLRGTIGLAFRDLTALRRRLRDHGVDFEEVAHGPLTQRFGQAVHFETPTGVQLRAHDGRGPLTFPEVAAAGITLPGKASLGDGIRYVELQCSVGHAAGICRFYNQTLGVPASTADGVCLVPIGDQALIFREASEPLPPYDGHHVAVYVGEIGSGDVSDSFASMYTRVQDAKLVYNNPRFPHLTYNSMEDALTHAEFRLMDLVDPQTGEVAYQLEHEIRSLEHITFNGRAVALEARQRLIEQQQGHSEL